MTPSLPPDLPGHSFERALGRGGFADVFLYRQELPARPVAIKVLRDPVRTEADRLRFANEANRMAALSSHPGIVTIYGVGTAPDGRPYLSMEFCARGHLGDVVARRPLSVARALDVGVKLAAAVETAHRSGILHRDVKPANVLLTDYDEPALIDFGIAGGADGVDAEDGSGVSIPFAAPEVAGGSTPGDELSDVYALGATVYALLAGRSPFNTPEVSGEADLLRRVLAGAAPPTGRPDVPEDLEQVLATALRSEPARRHASAADFGRSLQEVQSRLGLVRTPMRLGGESAPAPVGRRPEDPDDPDGTRLRGVPRVSPTPISSSSPSSAPPPSSWTPPSPSTPSPPSPSSPSPSTSAGGPEPAAPTRREASWGSSAMPSAADLGSRTIRRTGRQEPAFEPEPEGPDPAEEQTRRRRRLTSIAGAAVIALAALLVFLRVGSRDDTEATPRTTTPGDAPLITGGPPRPDRVRIEPAESGGQIVTWSATGAAEDDRYRVTVTDGPADRRGDAALVEERSWRADTDRRLCVVVETVRGAKVSESSREVCSR